MSPFLELRQTRSQTPVRGKFPGADVLSSGVVRAPHDELEQRTYQRAFSPQFSEMPKNEGC